MYLMRVKSGLADPLELLSVWDKCEKTGMGSLNRTSAKRQAKDSALDISSLFRCRLELEKWIR